MGNPPQTGLVEAFTLVPPSRHNSWSSKFTTADRKEVTRLHKAARQLARDGLAMVEVVMAVLDRGIQQLKAKAHPMYMYTDEGDVTRSLHEGYYEGKSPQEILSMMFKGKTADFAKEIKFFGFSAEDPPKEVSIVILNFLSPF